MERWYTLFTKPNNEYQAAAALQQRGIQVYLPEINSSTQRGHYRRPFFPCYLFIKVDFEQVGISHVQWTPGLRSVVTFGHQPVPLADEIIDLIRSKLGELEAKGGQPAHPFKRGDTVRITAGPLQDMLAIFDGPNTPAQRVQVLLTILGHVSRTQIDVNDLEKASAGAVAPQPERVRRTRGRGRPINHRLRPYDSVQGST